eukprot:604082-Hanusia_phi.AAC.2
MQEEAKKQVGSADKLKHDLASPASSSGWTLSPDKAASRAEASAPFTSERAGAGAGSLPCPPPGPGKGGVLTGALLVRLRYGGRWRRRAGGGSSEREGEYKGKFSMAAGSEAIYGALEEYHGGLIQRVGLPSKLEDLRKGMEDEQRSRADSEEPFTPPNYPHPTTPMAEWPAESRRRL